MIACNVGSLDCHIAYHIIYHQESYRKLGASYFDQQRSKVTTERLVKRLKTLGCEVSLQTQVFALIT